jgi:hypothetical protein
MFKKFVGPKNTKFILPQSLLRGASSQKVSKNPKIYCTPRSLPESTKTSFRADCPLGVNPVATLCPPPLKVVSGPLWIPHNLIISFLI